MPVVSHADGVKMESVKVAKVIRSDKGRDHLVINPSAPNDVYIRRTTQLTSRRCILNIYSTNILTEYFKHAAHSPFFSPLQDVFYFILLTFLVPVIFTF